MAPITTSVIVASSEIVAVLIPWLTRRLTSEICEIFETSTTGGGRSPPYPNWAFSAVEVGGLGGEGIHYCAFLLLAFASSSEGPWLIRLYTTRIGDRKSILSIILPIECLWWWSLSGKRAESIGVVKYNFKTSEVPAIGHDETVWTTFCANVHQLISRFYDSVRSISTLVTLPSRLTSVVYILNKC